MSHSVRWISVIACACLATTVLDAAVVIDPPTCKVTRPHGLSPDLHGNALISTDLWPDGTIVFRPGGPGFVTADGALAVKWGWRRAVRGPLRIEGRRLDESAPPLRASIPAGYGDVGFQSSALIFPTPGCWEVTGRVGTASLTFVTLVQRIGAGPSAPSPLTDSTTNQQHRHRDGP